jgi:hypothetical protein
MVDPAKGIGQTPGVSPAEKPQAPVKSRKNDDVEKTDDKRRDEIVASRKRALNVEEARDAARATREKLENSDHSLGLGQSFDEKV